MDMTSMSGPDPTPRSGLWPDVGVALYDVSARLAATPPEAWDTVIADALCTLGKALNVDRAYLAWLDAETATFRESHEWCAPGVASITAAYQSVPIHERPHAYARMMRLSVNHVPDVEALPDQRRVDRDHLMRRGAKA